MIDDCPSPTMQNRWYRDGYCARLNGKPLSANPKMIVSRQGIGEIVYFPAKAQRWEKGWRDADDVLSVNNDWDRTQDLIDELMSEP